MNYIIYFILIFLTTYSDSFLTPYLKAFGFSMLPTVSYILYLYKFVLCRKKAIWSPFSKSFANLLNYTLLISFLMYVAFLIVGYGTFLYGEDLLVKAFKIYITYLAFVIFLVVIADYLRKLSVDEIFKPFFYINIFLAIFGLVEYSMIPNAFISLHHAMGDSYNRVRLLTQESSHTAPLIEMFFLMSAFYSLYVAKKKTYFYITLACLIGHICISGSKSFMAILGISLVYGMWEILKVSKHKFLILVAGVVSVVLFVQFIYFNLRDAMVTDIEDSTSTATRSCSIISGFLMGVVVPMGSGFSGYLVLLGDIMKWMARLYPSDYDMSELYAYINNTDSNGGFSAKSFFSQGATFWGCIGTYFLVKKLLKVFRDFLRTFNPAHIALFKTAFCIMLINMTLTTGLSFIYLAVIAIVIHLTKYRISI